MPLTLTHTYTHTHTWLMNEIWIFYWLFVLPVPFFCFSSCYLTKIGMRLMWVTDAAALCLKWNVIIINKNEKRQKDEKQRKLYHPSTQFPSHWSKKVKAFSQKLKSFVSLAWITEKSFVFLRVKMVKSHK